MEATVAANVQDLPVGSHDRVAAAISIRELAHDDAAAAARWDAFVLGCPQATFFHRAGLAADHSRRLPPPHLVPAGRAQWRDRGRAAARAGEERAVRECAGVAAVRRLRRRCGSERRGGGGVGASRPGAGRRARRRPPRVPQRGCRVIPDWPTQDLYVTFRKEILPEVEANMLAIPRKQRAMVRKGIKNELRSVVDATPDRFFALYSDNVHRHGTPPYSLRYFEALQREFGRDCEVLTVEDKDGKPLSSVVSFYFRDEVLPYYAGDDVAARELAANDFKYWELMRRACERGLKVFDYGRSKKDTGPYAFKKNWGFEPQPLHYEYCLYKRDSIPQNNPANPKYRLFIAAWRKLPLGVANALGPHIVKYLG